MKLRELEKLPKNEVPEPIIVRAYQDGDLIAIMPANRDHDMVAIYDWGYGMGWGKYEILLRYTKPATDEQIERILPVVRHAVREWTNDVEVYKRWPCPCRLGVSR